MTPSWIRPVDGAGTWKHTPRHRPWFTDLLVATIACLLFCVLLAALYVAGRHVMCNAYDQQLRNCPGYVAEVPR